MMKIEKMLAFLVSLLIIISGILLVSSTENQDLELYKHSWSKAICTEENLCRDYLIECESKEIIRLSPITGYVQFESNWEDPRSQKEIDKFC